MDTPDMSTALATFHDRQDLHRIGTGTALEDIERRLRRLEEVHESLNSQDANPTVSCKAAAELVKQVEAQGAEYNVLEETVFALECSNTARESRIMKLENRLDAAEENGAVSRHPLQEAEKADTTAKKSEPVSIIPELAHDLIDQKSQMNSLSNRLKMLEGSRSQLLRSCSTHEVAQELLRRLGNSEQPDRIVHLQLQTTLSGIPLHANTPLPWTPGATSASKRATSCSRTTDEYANHKRGPGRPRKNRLSDSSAEMLPRKKRGRPSKQSQGSRKTSEDPNASRTSVESLGSSQHRNTGRSKRGLRSISNSLEENMAGVRDKDQVVFESQSNDKMSVDVSCEELLERFKKHQSDTEQSSADKIEEPDEVKGCDQDQLESATAAQNHQETASNFGSDEPLSSLRKRKRRVIESEDEIEIETSAPDPKTPLTPKGPYSSSQGLHSSTETPGVKASQPSSDQINIPIGIRCKRSRDGSMDDICMENAAGEQVVIPPERRSDRKSKRTKPFGDVMSWKEAHMQMKGMKLTTPNE